jgi:hypothetical protein
MLTRLSALLALWWICVASHLGCADYEPQGLRVGPQHGRKVEAHPFYADPIVMPWSQYVMVPFWMHEPQTQAKMEFFSGSSQWSGSSADQAVSLGKAFGDYVMAAGHWNNLIFCERGSDRCKLLLDRPAVICRAYFPQMITKGQAEILLFGIADKDTNGDGYINARDAVVLYASQADGSHLTRLTPEGTQVTSIVDGGIPDVIYVRVLRDSNGDRQFVEGEDEAVILRVNLRSTGEGQEVIGEEAKRRVREIVEKR